MKAAERIHDRYLNVYSHDVLRGTRGQPTWASPPVPAKASGEKESARGPDW
jgi:hypothetical protein